ncbi:MAG: amidohydrolase family protein [Deltaproteobacteria bacterium]|nr:amidohydrolase family protein [Deltaproteobacteria bacterium]
MHDLVIRGGTVFDGTGGPARKADIAIDGDQIAAVGTDVGEGRREIDATGQLVLPGWVDVHTHYDGQVTWDTHLTPSGWNGVTTIVMGNCGVGFAPVRPGQEAFLIQLMEGVEDIPGSALSEGMKWGWETFGEYLDVVEKMPHAIDVGAQVPHGAVRAYVMGERGAKNEKATPEEITEMSQIVREGLEAGALGFSTSRTILHRAKDGELVPGTTADEDEVLGIGRALGEAGHGVFQVASDLTPEGKELDWMKRLSRETGRRVSFACLQNGLDPEQWRRLLHFCEEDAAEGGLLTPQVAQRPAGMLLGWESTVHPFVFYPEYQKLAALPIDARRKELADPAVRARILENAPDLSAFAGVIAVVAKGYDTMFPLGDPPDYEPGPEKSIAAIAKREGRDPAEVVYDVMQERDGEGFVYLPLLGYAGGDLEAIREMMLHPQAIFGLSDGGAHCGLICDASMPTYLLTHWARDRDRGERIPIEFLVESQTRRTAEAFGMDDRGVLEPGMKADVNVVDFDALHIHAPEMVHDLPAEGRRLIQKVDGYRYTICSGEVIYEDGEPTGALPGKLIRGPQARASL